MTVTTGGLISGRRCADDHVVPVAADTSPLSHDDGVGMLGIVLALLVLAAAGVGAVASLGGGPTSPASGTSALGGDVRSAYDTQAQSALANAMQNVRAAAVADGGTTGLDLSQFGVTSGAAQAPGSVSGAVADTAGGNGAVTLATSSQSGTCWFVWFADGSTFYGAEPDATQCAATAMGSAPMPGRPAPGAIGWQPGSFPVTG